MNQFLTSNEAKWRLARTIVQGVIGVIIANLDLLIGMTPTPVALKPVIVALVMACLSPIMAYIGGIDDPDQETELEPEDEILEEPAWVPDDCQSGEATEEAESDDI